MKKVRFLITAMFIIVTTISMASCAAMDMRVDKVVMNPSYGKVKSHLPVFEGKFSYVMDGNKLDSNYTQTVTGKPDTSYVQIAQYTIQEDQTVMMAVSAEQMIFQMCKLAWENGADAVINVKIDTVQLYNGRRTSPRVQGVAIRYQVQGE